MRASRGEEGRRREAEEGDERGRTTMKPMGEGRTEKEMIFSRGVGAPRAATAARNQACGTEGARRQQRITVPRMADPAKKFSGCCDPPDEHHRANDFRATWQGCPSASPATMLP